MEEVDVRAFMGRIFMYKSKGNSNPGKIDWYFIYVILMDETEYLQFSTKWLGCVVIDMILR